MPTLYQRIIELSDTETAISLLHYLESDISTDGKTKKVLLSEISDLIDATIRDDIITDAVDDALNDLAGSGVIWWGTDDPAVSGKRILLLTGQTILMASYPELALAVYVGDGNNATASAFYKTSDTPGTIRDTGGAYMVFPDGRGYALRGLDVAAAVDPDGASRDIGSIQLSAMWGHRHPPLSDNHFYTRITGGAVDVASAAGSNTVSIKLTTGNPVTDGARGIPLLASESRIINIACNFGIRY